MPAAFEMEEILYELREHSRGLNAGRWDYHLLHHQEASASGATACSPTAAQVTMTVPFMRAYTELLVKTCHRRGAHAMGGMAAFIPSRKDAEVNETALARVREDKLARPGRASTAPGWPTRTSCRSREEVFEKALGGRPNQKERLREEVAVTAEISSSTRRCRAGRSPRPASAATSTSGSST